jgi:ABC-2 type transport system ATP-binding protein
VRVRLLPNQVPTSLAGMLVGEEGDSRILALERFAQVEALLAELRLGGIEVQELEVMQADLEDVFVQMMHRH